MFTHTHRPRERESERAPNRAIFLRPPHLHTMLRKEQFHFACVLVLFLFYFRKTPNVKDKRNANQMEWNGFDWIGWSLAKTTLKHNIFMDMVIKRFVKSIYLVGRPPSARASNPPNVPYIHSCSSKFRSFATAHTIHIIAYYILCVSFSFVWFFFLAGSLRSSCCCCFFSSLAVYKISCDVCASMHKKAATKHTELLCTHVCVCFCIHWERRNEWIAQVRYCMSVYDTFSLHEQRTHLHTCLHAHTHRHRHTYTRRPEYTLNFITKYVEWCEVASQPASQPSSQPLSQPSSQLG